MEAPSTDYLICLNCETPCYIFDFDKSGGIASALCASCGNDDPAEFMLPETFDEGGE
jgi:hypothetical protein